MNAISDEDSDESIVLVIRNHGSSAEKVSIFDAYSGKMHTRLRHLHDGATFVSLLHKSFGWYDLTVPVDSDASFERQLAGHVETGRRSMSDPAIGAATPQAVDAD